VSEIDDHVIGSGRRGTVTAVIQDGYEAAIRGRDARYASWLDLVQLPAAKVA
jgi:hypothetical protein